MNTDLPVPGRLGPYRIDGPLAAGGMGQVYRAYDERLERAVAIKRVLAERTNDPVSRQRLRREAKAVAALNHPAVVQIHDLLETVDGDWLVMELVPGHNLRQLLHEHALNSIPDILAIAEQIVDGLAAAHDQGIIHRDLKDANVMVTPSRQVKLLDFGIAKQVRSTDTTLSQPGTLLGTVHTMSPEQVLLLAAGMLFLASTPGRRLVDVWFGSAATLPQERTDLLGPGTHSATERTGDRGLAGLPGSDRTTS